MLKNLTPNIVALFTILVKSNVKHLQLLPISFDPKNYHMALKSSMQQFLVYILDYQNNLTIKYLLSYFDTTVQITVVINNRINMHLSSLVVLTVHLKLSSNYLVLNYRNISTSRKLNLCSKAHPALFLHIFTPGIRDMVIDEFITNYSTLYKIFYTYFTSVAFVHNKNT